MDFLNSISQTISSSFTNIGIDLIAFIPDLIAATIILIIGLIIAKVLANITKRLIELTKIDGLLNKIDIIEKLNKSGANASLAVVIAWLVKWFLIIVTLIAVADILSLNSFNAFLLSIASYFPSVVVAVLILVAGIVFGGGVSDITKKLLNSSNLKVGGIVAAIGKWAIIIFSIMAALIQLQVATALINTLFTGIVFMLALAGGLAFGLGGRDAAGQFISSVKEELKR